MDHLIDPSPPGEKVIPINFRNLDFEDTSGVPFSFKACKSPEEICDWYGERMSQYPPELSPYITFKTLYPLDSIPARTRSGFYIDKGNFNLSFT